jgi:hypothetical protein
MPKEIWFKSVPHERGREYILLLPHYYHGDEGLTCTVEDSTPKRKVVRDDLNLLGLYEHWQNTAERQEEPCWRLVDESENLGIALEWLAGEEGV